MYIDTEALNGLRGLLTAGIVTAMTQPPHAVALVPDRSGRRVLMARQPDGRLALPSAQCEEDTDLTGKVVQALRRRWGIVAPFLRSPAKTRRGHTPALWLCAYEPAHGKPPQGLEWADIDLVAAQTGLPDELAAAAAVWRDEQCSGETPPRRAPWARPGWFDTMRAWVTQQLEQRGIDTVGEPEMHQQWGISAVYRQATSRGDYYFKAVFGSPGRGFWHEPKVTLALADAHGARVTPVAAIDSDRGWMLMPDMGLAKCLSEADEAAQVSGLVDLARIQREWMSRTGELESLGCPDRSPHVLRRRLPELIDDALHRTGLTEDESAQLRSHTQRLYETCDRASGDPIPLTLMHGDFHTGNVGVRADGTVCIFDWSDAAAGHPFWDTDIYLKTAKPQAGDRLRDAYLQEWSDHASRPVLRQSFDDALVLAAVNQVITYAEIVAELEEDDRTFSNGKQHWWRQALEAMRRQAW